MQRVWDNDAKAGDAYLKKCGLPVAKMTVAERFRAIVRAAISHRKPKAPK